MRLGLKLKKESKPPQEQQQEQPTQEFKFEFIFFNNNSQQQFDNQDSKQFKLIVQKKNTKEQMIIQKDYVYIGEIQNNKMHGNGKIYIKQYDAYCNNNYFVYEGQFQNDQIDGRGTEYYGKTNNKKVDGVFQKLSLIEKFQEYNQDGSILIKQQNLQQSMLQQSFIQEDRSTNKTFRIKSGVKQTPPQPQQQKPQVKQNDKWTKFDVELSKDHLSSLLSEKAINDSIIEAYLNYINYIDSEKFFNLKSLAEIQAYKRTLIIPYFLFEQQKIDILNYFAEFSYFKGQFWQVYQQIFVIVNSNGHWILLELLFEGQDIKMKVYDSCSKKKAIFYVTTCKHIWNMIEPIVKQYNLTISWKSKDIIISECPQLAQPNDSGIFICAYLKYLISNISLDQITQEVINNIRKTELFNIVKKEK
ncbi:unnamed protein product (macronuclear) [Paramecium tetraurelia]|uniref:Ubiquitin-like protease family profile domain-containing protein n=1 Tax=Paramecium tetraurelia TaxID=5888 RepID=A0BN45_PARTE|nr:uncharacterized protein GSPATT00030600001 [Paramecium tetraurelia]CAK59962.1 unnamed protein product [Paramecium tetraurelia]|eukprot:XP_001427360.1 hypothetical protein (macronuclear) [Paramecium tetraurelia strain d4-2]